MEILFVTTKTPLPMNDGHSLRTCNILKQLAKRYRIHLLSFVKFPDEYEYKEELLEFCETVELIELPENSSRLALLRSLFISLINTKPFVLHKYDKRSMRLEIKNVLSEHDVKIVHLDMLPLAVYLDEVKGYRAILNEHNVESALLARRVEEEKNILYRIFYRMQQRWLERYEKLIISRFDNVLACSEVDAKILRKFSPSTQINVIPNGVDTKYFSTIKRGSSESLTDLIFVGGFNWYPNLDAIRWFDEQIFPRVLIDSPSIVLHVIGADEQQSRNYKWKCYENIIFHGRVKDIRPYIEKASLFVVPLRIGGGTRLKILNAMAMGKCVVSTTIGAEGLSVIHEKNIILADDAKTFADAILKCLLSSNLREKIRNESVLHIENSFTWDTIGTRLNDVYEATF